METEKEIFKKKSAHEVTLQLRLKKKQLLGIIIVLFLAIIGLALYSTGLINNWLTIYQRASLTTAIKNSESNQAIDGAIFWIDDHRIVSDKTGQVVLDNLRAGEKQIKVTKSGFQTYQTTLTLLRGENSLPAILLVSAPAEKISYKGQVVDYISQIPIKDASVSLDQVETQTDDQGIFIFDQAVSGKSTITIDKVGFRQYKQEQNINRAEITPVFSLITEKKVYFISNRDGKKGIYSSDIDGSNQQRVVPKSEKGEEQSLSISPGYRFAYFTSERDGIKDEDNHKVSLGYLIDLKTADFKKISDDQNPSGIKWRNDNQYLIYQATKRQNNQYLTSLISFNIEKGETKTLWQGQGSTYPYFASQDYIFVSASQYNSGQALQAPTGTLLIKLDGSETKQVILDIGYNLKEDSLNQIIYFNVSRDDLKYSYDTDKLEIKEIKEIPEDIQSYVFAPNGDYMAYSDTRDGKDDIYLKASKGGEETKLTKSGIAYGPTWLDDENILYLQTSPGESALYIISPLGGEGKKVTDVTESQNYSNYGQF